MATNLLLVDESPLVQRVAELAFRGKGVYVHAAESADAALTLAETAPLDVFVVSADMERSDGLAFCRLLRQRPEFSRAPILILTSGRRAVSDGEIAEVGAAGRVEKPFRPETFTREVERLIAGADAAPAPRTWEREDSDSLEKAMIEDILAEEEPPPSVGGAEERPAPPPPDEESRPEAQDPAGGTDAAAGEKEAPPDAAALAPAIRKALEESLEKAVPTLLGRVEAVVVARLPDLMERIVLREIEKIKRGE